MLTIRTPAEFHSLADPELQAILAPYVAAMEEFGEDLSIVILIVANGDTLAQAEHIYGKPLVVNGRFALAVEKAREHNKYAEIVHIASDDGAGLVLIVSTDGDAELLAACREAIAGSSAPS